MTVLFSLSAGIPFGRALPPAPLSANLPDILRAWRLSGQGIRSGERLTQACELLYPERDIVLCRSGTEALFRIFTLLRAHSAREFVLVSAYTCPDVAAAIVRAGFRLALLDLHPRSLSANPNTSSVDFKACAAAVLSNLYGLPEDIQPWRALAQENDFLLLDDACQSALSFEADTRVGGRTDAIGILSFGRGKALSGLGGGALVLPKRGRSVFGCSAQLLEALHEPSKQAWNFSPLTELEETIRAIAIGFLGKPRLYRLPSSLPFLHLGETHCDLEFSLRKRGRVASAAALARLQTLSQFSLEQVECLEGWLENLPASQRTLVDPVFERSRPILIRFPILCESVLKKRQYLSRLTSAGLGASGSYPSTLRAYAPFSGISLCGPLKEARKLAERIVTLPVHRYVLPADQTRVAQILGEQK